jgi:hypothetical protein
MQHAQASQLRHAADTNASLRVSQKRKSIENWIYVWYKSAGKTRRPLEERRPQQKLRSSMGVFYGAKL